ncbi:MAG TPA: hypothetical protein VLC10_03270 [Patescibacteria group bacterium]|nr:hypothetical protein [Patescibacteria group bacterium]
MLTPSPAADKRVITEPLGTGTATQTPSNVGFVVKTLLCILAFAAAAAVFAYACAELMVDYSLVFTPSKELTLPWLIRMGAGSFAFLLTFGVIAVLVRPLWLAAMTLAGGMVVYAFVLGGGLVAWCGAAVGAAMLLGLLYSVAKQIENQIDFTLRPVSDKELVISSILAILVAVPVGLGYAVDAEKGHYVIPPRITAYVQEQSMAYVEKMVDAQLVPEMLRGSVTSAAKEQVAATIKGLDKMAEPYAPYVPYALGALAYFSFQVLLFIPGFIASLLLAPFIWLLKVIRFAHVTKQTRVVTRLTLAREPPEPPKKTGPDPWASVA